MEEQSASPAAEPEREFHAVARLFPLLRGAAFTELSDDIRKNGLREPILLDPAGRILDGRSRYLACREAGVEPRFAVWNGEGSPAEVSLSLNLQRRHLNESQRALVAARLALMDRGLRPGRPKKGAHLHPFPAGKRAVRVSEILNVSPRLVSLALRVVRLGSERLIAAVESDVLTVSAAALLAGLSRQDQDRLALSGRSEMARKARELRCGPEPDLPSVVVIAPRRFRVLRTADGAAALLWLAAEHLDAAVEALQARGFRQAGPPPPSPPGSASRFDLPRLKEAQ